MWQLNSFFFLAELNRTNLGSPSQVSPRFLSAFYPLVLPLHLSPFRQQSDSKVVHNTPSG
jgi:hypothetical protein